MCFERNQAARAVRSFPALFRLFRLLSAVSLPVLFQACTILENRSVCPCTLYLDMSDPKNGICDTLVVNLWTADGFSAAYAIPKEDFGQVQVFSIPSRNGVGICVLEASASAMYSGGCGGGINIPLGEQCPVAYMYSSFCETASETCSDVVTVSKNYCGVTMNFVSEDIELYDIRITGNVSGYTSSGLPVEGEFEYAPNGSRSCYFRLPRQLDGSLKLSLSIPGGREKVFALGQYIVQSGYDWTKIDLEDLAMTIDYASTSLTITIDQWSTTVEYDVVV